jgi:hypothetical protein
MSDLIRARVALPPPKIRVRVLPALLPRQIELQNDGTDVQWRYVGDTAWVDLIAIDDIEASVEVGTVTTLAPGSPATVVNVGTDQHVILNFGIPQGNNATGGSTLVVTATGTTAVPAGTSGVIINLVSPGSVSLTLPAVADQSPTGMSISDYGGNANITLTPNGTEKIMGLTSAQLISAGQGLGSGASITLHPSTDLSGWFA